MAPCEPIHVVTKSAFTPPMHILQPKHTRLNPEEKERLLRELNITVAQLPKIKVTDPPIPKDCITGDVVKIERSFGERSTVYYRVVI